MSSAKRISLSGPVAPSSSFFSLVLLLSSAKARPPLGGGRALLLARYRAPGTAAAPRSSRRADQATRMHRADPAPVVAV